ncbi:MAG: OmpH family outer membrane protein [Lewinellaceae bacterium]|nr:OmpH family outer membrane protein [Phaeodactylibacter sp.]MCB0615214.1 OmpH family outer membrane protein [Phaeodactylibacter sp.]MCB9348116.1 OmpH family outer membrane protein [Lewinellaceae bacterium]
MMKKILLLFAFAAFGAVVSFAQEKYGHLNFGSLISSMEETKAADSELEAYRKQLVAKGEDMANKFQKDYEAVLKEAQAGNLTPAQQKEREQELSTRRDEILAYEQEVRQKVEAKRQELLTPIINNAEAAVKDLAKEKGYAIIFDTSVYNAVLFAQDADDVMSMVKAKLGIKEEEVKE